VRQVKFTAGSKAGVLLETPFLSVEVLGRCFAFMVHHVFLH